MKKVLVFVQAGVGGAERVSALIANSLYCEGYKVYAAIVHTHSCDDAKIKDFFNVNIPICEIPYLGVVGQLKCFGRAIRNFNPDYIFSSVINLNDKVLLLKPFHRNVKFIIRSDTNPSNYSNRQLNFVRLTYPLADRLIAQTEEMADELRTIVGVKQRRIVVLHNPVDKVTIARCLENQLSPYHDSNLKHYVAIGRFSQVKGFDLLIEAYAKLQSLDSKNDLFIVGETQAEDGIVYDAVIRLSEKYGISEKVHCVGYKANPYIYLRYADCFVLSSRWEGMPNVVLESLYLGTPVAAFDCVPIVSRIIDENTGIVAKKEDTGSLAEAMYDAAKMGRVNSAYISNVSDFIKVFQ